MGTTYSTHGKVINVDNILVGEYEESNGNPQLEELFEAEA
jgi:hypothetical protein